MSLRYIDYSIITARDCVSAYYSAVKKLAFCACAKRHAAAWPARLHTTPAFGVFIPAIGEKMDCLKACTNGGPASTISGESLPRYKLRAIATGVYCGRNPDY